jgi:hypothetical protein
MFSRALKGDVSGLQQEDRGFHDKAIVAEFFFLYY